MLSTVSMKGVTCPMCANSVSNALQSVEGVENFDVDFFDQITTVTFDDDEISAVHIRDTIDKANCSIH